MFSSDRRTMIISSLLANQPILEMFGVSTSAMPVFKASDVTRIKCAVDSIPLDKDTACIYKSAGKLAKALRAKQRHIIILAIDRKNAKELETCVDDFLENMVFADPFDRRPLLIGITTVSELERPVFFPVELVEDVTLTSTQISELIPDEADFPEIQAKIAELKKDFDGVELSLMAAVGMLCPGLRRNGNVGLYDELISEVEIMCQYTRGKGSIDCVSEMLKRIIKSESGFLDINEAFLMEPKDRDGVIFADDGYLYMTSAMFRNMFADLPIQANEFKKRLINEKILLPEQCRDYTIRVWPRSKTEDSTPKCIEMYRLSKSKCLGI